MKSFIRGLLRPLGVDIVRINQHKISDFVREREINLVLDVGANEGQFGQSLREHNYNGRIISFEPVAATFEKLTAATRHDPNWDTHNVALGETTGQTTINVSELSVFSSIRDSTEAATQFDQQAAVVHKEPIEVRMLDEMMPSSFGNVLLKIDTQGFEREVLRGAERTLPHITGVLMEVPIMQLYAGTWRFHDAVAFMHDAGFVPAQIHPVNFHPEDKASAVEFDCLFRRRDPRFDEPARAVSG